MPGKKPTAAQLKSVKRQHDEAGLAANVHLVALTSPLLDESCHSEVRKAKILRTQALQRANQPLARQWGLKIKELMTAWLTAKAALPSAPQDPPEP